MGACSPVARRLPAVEAALAGPVGDAAAERVMAGDGGALDPIDMRATAEYRRGAAVELIRRAVRRATA
ncbi:MAG: hypothetical protein R3D63_06315 [Paracoccaceae bacterium]